MLVPHLHATLIDFFTPLDYKLVVQTPLREEIIKKTVFRGCVVKVGEADLKADLIPLEIQDFYAILGMDWLNKH